MKRTIIQSIPLLALLLIAACGGSTGSSAATLSSATITPLAEASTALPAAPTSTLAPTAQALGDLQEWKDAQAQINAKNFDTAISLLNRVYAAHRDDAQVQEQFASAYLLWGQQILSNSAGDPTKISLALDKFTSGLAVAPDTSGEHTQLQAETALARSFVEATTTLQKLKAASAANNDLAQQQAAARDFAEQLDQMQEQRADYPGLQQLYVQGMNAIGQIYLTAATTSGDATLLAQAQAVCGRALKLDAQNQAALACQKRAVPTPAPRPTSTPRPAVPTKVPPTPIPRPSKLAVGKLNSNDSPGCLSIQLSGVSTSGWRFTIDGLHLGGFFDGGGNARVCGLPDNAVTFTVRNAGGAPVPGGGGIPAKGGDIFVGRWK